MAQEQGEASEQLQARVAALKTENGRQAEEIARLLKKVGGFTVEWRGAGRSNIHQQATSIDPFPPKSKTTTLKKKQIRDLEEENDLLALDNEQLREKVNNAGAAADEEEGPAAATAATTSVLFGSAMARLGGWVLITVD